ncbi:LolA family protein [Pseudaestuariivita rosea]|uniref:LolA family protein n=1 Tax=Pseudaestuariivita rosea TaxID=2763263 RepID=UPI001ABB912E|nr:outer membrane lipoprotein carrier protein LolA [Pseudaestuariivita rosea]
MKRFILIPILWAALALPSAAEKLSLDAISAYLNSFETASGKFTQVNADQTIATGDILMKRPGRVRFEYNPPDEALVIAGGGQVAIFDGKSNSNPTQYPLRRTPLSIILDRNVDFARARMVVAHDYDGTSTIVTAQDPENPQYGNIQLFFTPNPVELRKWIITDENGTRTEVILQDMQTGVQIGSRPFNIVFEAENWN